MRPIDADALLEAIEELKKSPWYNGENGNFERIVRSDAIGIIEDLCVKEAPTLDYAPKWISVKDRLPEDDVNVIVYAIGNNEDSVIAMTSYTHNMHGYGIEGWRSPWQYFFYEHKITHWMLPPEPPKEDAE